MHLGLQAGYLFFQLLKGGMAMPMLRVLLGCCVVTILMLVSAKAEGDISEGQRIARELCAECHNVDAEGPFKLYPPSFASIAVYRSSADIRGLIVFPPLHSSMPQLGSRMTPDNVDNVVAYIVSLEKGK